MRIALSVLEPGPGEVHWRGSPVTPRAAAPEGAPSDWPQRLAGVRVLARDERGVLFARGARSAVGGRFSRAGWRARARAGSASTGSPPRSGRSD